MKLSPPTGSAVARTDLSLLTNVIWEIHVELLSGTVLGRYRYSGKGKNDNF